MINPLIFFLFCSTAKCAKTHLVCECVSEFGGCRETDGGVRLILPVRPAARVAFPPAALSIDFTLFQRPHGSACASTTDSDNHLF